MSASVYAQQGAQQFEGFNLQGYTDGGQKSWDVEGDTADVSGQTIKITNVNANAYGDEKINLKAKTGTINKDDGNLHLEEDVVITSEEGSQLTTDSLDWQRDNDLVTTDDRVQIIHEELEAFGKGMEAHPNLKSAQLNEDVTVKVVSTTGVGNTQRVTITCDGPMEMDQLNNKVVFKGNVVAIQEGRELRADKLEMSFDPDTRKINQMVCTGNVIVTQGENQSFSQKAVYEEATQKLILSGRPKLIMLTEGEGGISSFGN